MQHSIRNPKFYREYDRAAPVAPAGVRGRWPVSVGQTFYSESRGLRGGPGPAWTQRTPRSSGALTENSQQNPHNFLKFLKRFVYDVT